jgi:hypothetical protein
MEIARSCEVAATRCEINKFCIRDNFARSLQIQPLSTIFRLESKERADYSRSRAKKSMTKKLVTLSQREDYSKDVIHIRPESHQKTCPLLISVHYRNKTET